MADQTITRLAAEDHQTDWGMRIISDRSNVYDGFWLSLWAQCGRSLPDGLRSVNTGTIESFPHTPICARMPCSRWMVPWDTSRKFSLAITTSPSQPALRTRSGRPRWSSVRYCAEC